MILIASLANTEVMRLNCHFVHHNNYITHRLIIFLFHSDIKMHFVL